MPSSQTAGIVHWSKGMKGIGIVVGMQVGVIGLKVLHNYIPYSGKFSPGKIFAKARREVLRKKFARFIFAHAHLFRFHLTRS